MVCARRSKGCLRIAPLLGAVLLLTAACATVSCGSGAETAGAPEIRLAIPDNNPAAATIEVVGLPRAALSAVRARQLSAGEWTTLLRVTVAPESDAQSPSVSDVPPVAGSYAVTDTALVFTPLFGFDAGRQYRAVFEPSAMPAGEDSRLGSPLVAVVGRPKVQLTPSTVVAQVYPTTDIVPENQLHLYIHFSAPMGLKGGLEHVRLLDEQRHEVIDPFLPLDAEFWNHDHTRFTVFFDPGRVKRGILPNQQMGRSLVAGRRYTLVVGREWLDAQGLPLKEEFRRDFRVGPPDERPLDTGSWRLHAPKGGSRDPLIVTFPEPLDHGLLLRALGVTTAAGGPVYGEMRIEPREAEWVFIAREPWAPGEYHLLVLPVLEDLAGNRIGRAFEVDQFDRVDRQAEPDAINVPFRVDPAVSR